MKIVKNIEKLSETKEVQSMLKNIEGLLKPKTELAKYLNNLGKVYQYETDRLEKYLAIYSAWQNYLAEQLTVADTVRAVAESQKKYFYSIAVKVSKGNNISERKEVAIKHPKYQEALEVAIEADSIYRAVQTRFDNCERAYRLVSRILAKRINIRQLD